MLYTLGVHSPLAAAYGYQVIAAVGLGATMQQNMMVPQGELAALLLEHAV